jgi:serine/threonine-protein kinase
MKRFENLVGKVLHDTFLVQRVIAGGGMGVIYEAIHRRLPGRFAVKSLCGPMRDDAVELIRFRREAEIAARVVHPHTIRVVDYNSTDLGTPYLVMEMLEGRDLCRELEIAGPLHPDRVVDITRQIASALDAMHRASIVHRDLKPQNIFLGENDFVKIIDFGIAKVDDGSYVTDASEMLGSPGYVSPEQASGKLVDGRSDQFTLAATVYEMLAGVPAFRADNVAAVLYKVLHVDPPELTHVPGRMDGAIRRALAKNPQDRYATVSEFARELGRGYRHPSKSLVRLELREELNRALTG